jgi:hypothetical protein
MGIDRRFTGPKDPNIIPTETAFAELVELAQQGGVIKYRRMTESRVFHLQQQPDSTEFPWSYAKLFYNPMLPGIITFNNQVVDGHSSNTLRAEEFTKKYVGGASIRKWLEVAYVSYDEIEGMQFSYSSLYPGASAEA